MYRMRHMPWVLLVSVCSSRGGACSSSGEQAGDIVDDRDLPGLIAQPCIPKTGWVETGRADDIGFIGSQFTVIKLPCPGE
jgi:hypothetical protein